MPNRGNSNKLLWRTWREIMHKSWRISSTNHLMDDKRAKIPRVLQPRTDLLWRHFCPKLLENKKESSATILWMTPRLPRRPFHLSKARRKAEPLSKTRQLTSLLRSHCSKLQPHSSQASLRMASWLPYSVTDSRASLFLWSHRRGSEPRSRT